MPYSFIVLTFVNWNFQNPGLFHCLRQCNFITSEFTEHRFILNTLTGIALVLLQSESKNNDDQQA